jgi:outer membrane protein assembly factor BamB
VPQPVGRPVVAGGRVFLPTLGGLRTFALDGSPGWSLAPLADRSTAWVTGPAVCDGTAYVGTDDRRSLLALDAASGDEVWRVDVGDVSVPPVPDHDWGTVFVGTRDGTVARVDAASGEVRWTASVFGAVTSLATSADIAYAGTEAGEVYALFDGRGLWRRKLPGSVVDVALGNSGPVYATTFGGGTFELADGLHAGRTRWHVESGPATDSLVLADDAVYGADGGGLVAMHRHGEKRQWGADGSFAAGMAGAGDTLYVGGEDGVSAYRMGGGLGLGDLRVNARRWRVDVEGSVVRGLAVADGAVFAPVSGTEDTSAALVALDAS